MTLLEDSLRIGVTEYDFWGMTPIAVDRVAAAWRWNHEKEEKRFRTLAYMTAQLQRTKKMPSPERVINPPKQMGYMEELRTKLAHEEAVEAYNNSVKKKAEKAKQGVDDG